MEIVAWALAVLLAIAVAVLAIRKPENPYAGALDRLMREMERGDEVRTEVSDDPPEVAQLRRLIALEWEPAKDDGDPGQRALEGLVRYLREAALSPLRSELGDGDALPAAARQVVDVLEDLQFYAEPPPDEEASRQNLLTLVQEVVRDYIRETEIPVKVRASAPTLPVSVAPEAFKDALFMLLANAGRFGEGRTVVVEAEKAAEGVRIRVLDQGQGFSPEALEHAFEPFWSTDADAVGLGLTHARRVLQARGLRLRVGNREEGGAEAVILVPVD
ncbi:MAG: sensor histidine kinase [bacterium]